MQDKFREAINDPDNPVIDVNASGSDVMSMLVQEDEDSPPTLVSGDSENVLLYIHELKDFLDGERGAVVSHEPHVSVQHTETPSVYRLTVGKRPVETMPSQASDVLEGLRVAIEDGHVDRLLEVYEEILDSQVRRDVVKKLKGVLPNIDDDRVEVTGKGWVIDGFYVVDWTASVYVKSDDSDSKDFVRSGGSVREVDKSKEFVNLSTGKEIKRKKVKFNDDVIILGEREMLFLSKVEWLLKRAQYHPDAPFWRFNEKLRKQYLRGDDDDGDGNAEA